MAAAIAGHVIPKSRSMSVLSAIRAKTFVKDSHATRTDPEAEQQNTILIRMISKQLWRTAGNPPKRLRFLI